MLEISIIDIFFFVSNKHSTLYLWQGGLIFIEWMNEHRKDEIWPSLYCHYCGFPGGASGNAGDVRDMSLIPGWGRSPGGGYGYPLQYSCLEYPMNREAWQVLFHRGCKESDTTECLSMQVCTAQKLLSNIYIFMGVYILRRIFVQTTIWINGRKSIHQHFSFITIQVFLSLIYG